MLTGKPKSTFTVFAMVSVIMVLVIWLCNVNFDRMAQSGPGWKHSSYTKEIPTNSKNPNININMKYEPWQEEHFNVKQQQRKQPNRTSDEEFVKRRRRVNYVCSTGQVSGNVSFVMNDKQAGIIYCSVPKAGCTFWKRVFTAVNSKNDSLRESIRFLSREEVHSQYIQRFQYNSTDFPKKTFPTRLIVTRDPYSRLLSSYLDKIYLPDFWISEVVKMVKTLPNNTSSITSQDFLRNHFNEMANVFKNKSVISRITTAAQSHCGKYMTFSEFAESGFENEEPHWTPIHKICNPCKFLATHISKMETFSADARALLSLMQLETVMDNLDDDNAQIDEEINIISSYNFHHFYRNVTLTFYKPCLFPKEIAYRLWYNFRWRGYIDPDVDYKLPELTDLKDIEEDFMVQVRAARKSGLQNPNKMKATKNEFRKKAFLSLSKAMFEKLSQKYAIDFELFGYTDIRDELYSFYSG
ncbi:unnamed protein product [Candidula unifasciata]|uniref:Carbohydrate sulfotransferase n=1 Tax=Candidula unifasciata TaxID=100452 RepID=A0A8S3YJX6_9EUPU|nr:unnamed protein product [Candidula unifasciata]